eukprot:TRINITY_DN8272_c0_g1_i4.p1 TRINITY_DN8272_c0_g1~~TRINITY_DN8272_c0_g1_i4.p1  ORF type:complete len:110 (+),score=20.34 TRINITY_DN8272_c0_g1_i4:91-420(+)
MLRSLVGSEMCIRDRSYNGVSRSYIYSIPEAIRHVHASLTTARNEMVTCDQKTRPAAPNRAAVRPSSPSPLNQCVFTRFLPCLLYTSDAADEEDSVDLGGRRIIKKKKK